MSDVSGILLTLMLAINQAFFMGFFFMISSYFTPRSLEKKGTKKYLVDRSKRLGIPLLLYILFVDPLLIYITQRASGETQSLWQSVSRHYSSIYNFGSGQLWFVAALLLFSLIYAIWPRFMKPTSPIQQSAPSNTKIAIFALALGVVTFIVRIWIPVGEVIVPVLSFQFAHFPQYIALFVVGIVAYRNNWFQMVTAAQGKRWIRVVLGLIVFFPVLLVAAGALEGNVDKAMGGVHWESLAYSVWEQFMCQAMIISLLVWFRRHFNRQGKVAKTLSNAAYATYVFHAPTIILLAIALSSIRFPDMGLKYVVVMPFAVAAAFLVGTLAKRLPAANTIL